MAGLSSNVVRVRKPLSVATWRLLVFVCVVFVSFAFWFAFAVVDYWGFCLCICLCIWLLGRPIKGIMVALQCCCRCYKPPSPISWAHMCKITFVGMCFSSPGCSVALPCCSCPLHLISAFRLHRSGGVQLQGCDVCSMTQFSTCGKSCKDSTDLDVLGIGSCMLN